ncbi:hypothetical protein [Legionella maioricensis]|uniref:Uncharacterized protein n=1 Tax=Legionella maioricensis TaxID=2896528 RepID=A0A9X2D015_9GAMM|nr:hypothetical protein [Legionella maioricensis]MCL9683936.1 hypothetical protein [Legionella maioricensis]MCL9688298.1 hypothetical protein [Legionella maioricensis]
MLKIIQLPNHSSYPYLQLDSNGSTFKSKLYGDYFGYECNHAPIQYGIERNALGEKTSSYVIQFKKTKTSV